MFNKIKLKNTFFKSLFLVKEILASHNVVLMKKLSYCAATIRSNFSYTKTTFNTPDHRVYNSLPLNLPCKSSSELINLLKLELHKQLAIRIDKQKHTNRVLCSLFFIIK